MAKKSANSIDEHIGAKLRARRITLGLSQQELGEAIEITFQQVQKYERGSNRISASGLFELSQVLKVGISYFFQGLDVSVSVAPGFADASQEAYAADPIAPSGGWELNGHFARIRSPDTRKLIVDIVEKLADGEGSTDS
jgi:transcriptional regulator with XRE-family HTH domain